MSLYIFHQFYNSFTTLAQITTSWGAFKMISIKLIKMIIDISTSDMTTVFLIKNIHFWICESTSENTQFWVSKINKKNVSGISCIELGLTEHTIIQSNCSWFIYETSDSKFSNFSSIQNSFSFKLSKIGWYSNNSTLVIKVILLNSQF